MLDWTPAKVSPVDVRFLASHGRLKIQTGPCGSGTRSSSCPDIPARELSHILANVIPDEEKGLEVPPAVTA